MKQKSFFLAVFAGLWLASVRGAEKEWAEYHPGKGVCSIKLPAAPEYQTNIVDTMTTHVYTAKDATQAPARVYSIGYGDYAKEKVANTDGAKKILDTDRDNFIKTVNGKLIVENAITKDTHPGRAVLISGEDGKVHYLLREYLVGNRVFQLAVCVPAAINDDPDAAKFFDSFQLPGK